MNILSKYVLEIIVFISGAVVMILELAGSRILAPYLGTSIYVWTSLIGIILGSLSLGYFWGGKLADKKPDFKTFSFLLLMAALLVGIVGLIQSPVLRGIERFVPDIRVGAVVAATLLFAPASIFLGTVSPFAVRLKIKDVSQAGSTAGRLYAISTVGSIFGTFLAGFFLISFFGSSRILIFLAGLLFLLSLLACYRKVPKSLQAGRFFTALVLGASFVHTTFMQHPGHLDIDTSYNRIIIEEMIDQTTQNPIRVLRTDHSWGQSVVFTQEPDRLYFAYNRFYRLAEHFLQHRNRALLIGGGAYTFARDYLNRNPAGHIDVVEIDPQFTILAKKYFFLQDDPRITSVHDDGRTYLNRTSRIYDVIYLDVFKSAVSLPFQLTTLETFSVMSDRLEDKGALLANFFTPITGEDGRFFRAAFWTLRQIFPRVYAFPIQEPEDGGSIQNVIVVALKSEDIPVFSSDDQEHAAYLSHLWKEEIPRDVPLLTDDFAPVEHYLAEVIKAY